MGIKRIASSSGDKLQDTKTGKLFRFFRKWNN